MALWPLPISPSMANFNKHEAEKQRRWQEGMSETAHQREMADLRAAGLNPILSATRGMGAATPGGAVGSVSSGGNFDPASALSISRAKAEIENVKWDTVVKRELADKTRSESNFVNQLGKGAELDNTGRGLEAEIDRTKYGANLRYVDRLMKSLTGSAQSVRQLGGGLR